MTKAFLYLRTSSDDRGVKLGIEVQREGCLAFAQRAGFEVAGEFADDGITGTLPMHARPQGKLLIAALLGNGVKTVLCYDAKRIGRTQPAFWSFIGMCRDNGITVVDKDGTDLGGSVMGGVNGMLAEMDRNATVERLAAGKRAARAQGKQHVNGGLYHYGEHPRVEFAGEREVVQRVRRLHAEGVSQYAIAKQLNAEGLRTRYGKQFKVMTVGRIIQRNC